jgi:hypothetical protein
MMQRILLYPYLAAEPWLRHSNWMVRRVAQIVVVGIATIWLALPGAKKPEYEAGQQEDELARRLWASPRFLEFLNGPALAKPIVGPLCRVLVLRLSVHAQTRERASPEERNFLLRVSGPLDQEALRNLLIWQNHVLPSYLPRDDGRQVDIALVLTAESESEARLFDLFSILLMLERVRSFAVFWDHETATGTNSILLSERELNHWRTPGEADDLRAMPGALVHQVERNGTRGGIKLLAHGRRHANDFLKLALPSRHVVAVALREREYGEVEPEELEFWLGVIDTLHAQHPQAAFVMLNCLPPSQWREWPPHIRFARHQGLSLQDAICLAQIADGYIGVLDMFGLAAHSAGCPGIYVPLEDNALAGGEGFAEIATGSQIMVGSGNRANIEAALMRFAGALSGSTINDS